MLKCIKNRISRFRREEDGSIIAESVIMFPTLFAAVLATFVFFDAFRNQAIIVKANYTIADSLSRQYLNVTNTQMINTWNMHRFLTNSPSLTRLRISAVEYDAGTDSHTLVWSRAKGGGLAYDDTTIEMVGLTAAEIPVIPDGEYLIVVQTEVDYEPNYSIGFGAFTFENVSFTRPRWAPQFCYNHNDRDYGSVCADGS